jgi:hypothetical protein
MLFCCLCEFLPVRSGLEAVGLKFEYNQAQRGGGGLYRGSVDAAGRVLML